MPRNQKTPSLTPNKPSETTSEIDLSQLTIRELMDLRDRVERELASAQILRMGTNDIGVEYSITAHTNNGVIHSASGVLTLPSITHPRLIATAPGRAEALLSQQLLEPLMADLVDTLDSVNPESSSLLGLTQQVGPMG